jgi:hypothetical protein
MTTIHPRTLARRRLLRPFDLIIMQGVIYKAPKQWNKEALPTMPPPTRATIGDILDAAAIEGERPRDLLDRLRGADRQWMLDHGEDEIRAGGYYESCQPTSTNAV